MSQFISLAGEKIEALTGYTSEAGRLARGRGLFRKGAVSDVTVTSGVVVASVRGSGGDGYAVTVATAPAPRGVQREVAQGHDGNDPNSIDRLIAAGVQICPRVIDLAFTCECPDWEEPCKHSIAALFAFADRVDLDSEELLRWRGIHPATDSSGLNPITIPSPAEPDDEEHDSETAAPPEDRQRELDHLRALLGDTAVAVPSTGSAEAASDRRPLDPALAKFFGEGMSIEAITVGQLPPATPLFADYTTGIMAELGPNLDAAIATITAQLREEAESSDRR